MGFLLKALLESLPGISTSLLSFDIEELRYSISSPISFTVIFQSHNISFYQKDFKHDAEYNSFVRYWTYLFVKCNDENHEEIYSFSHFFYTNIRFSIFYHIGMNYIHRGTYKTLQESPYYHILEHVGQLFQSILLQNNCTELKYISKLYCVD